MYYRRFAVMTGFDRSVKAAANARDVGKLVKLDSNKVGWGCWRGWGWLRGRSWGCAGRLHGQVRLAGAPALAAASRRHEPAFCGGRPRPPALLARAGV
jgi:hypothetical protein